MHGWNKVEEVATGRRIAGLSAIARENHSGSSLFGSSR